MSDTDLHIAVSRGARAEILLKDDILVEAFETVGKELRRLWLATGAAECAERERLWFMIKLMDSVKSTIEEVVVSGKLAQAELDAEKLQES